VKFTVLWDPDAEQELAALWLDSARRLDVTRAADALEQKLQRNAPNEGESRPGGRRILFEDLLGILFRVDLPRRGVRVLHVWAIA
jgi:hypothetical protein